MQRISFEHHGTRTTRLSQHVPGDFGWLSIAYWDVLFSFSLQTERGTWLLDHVPAPGLHRPEPCPTHRTNTPCPVLRSTSHGTPRPLRYAERARQRSRAGLDHEVIEGHTIGRGHPVLRSVSRRRLRAGQIHDVGLDSRRWLFEVYQAQWVCL